MSARPSAPRARCRPEADATATGLEADGGASDVHPTFWLQVDLQGSSSMGLQRAAPIRRRGWAFSGARIAWDDTRCWRALGPNWG